MSSKINRILVIIPLFHRYFFSLALFLILSFIKAILIKSNRFVIMSCVGIILLMILIKIKVSKKKSKSLKYINDSMVLIINILIIVSLLYDEEEDPNLAIKLLDSFLSQILFLKAYCYKTSEVFSIIIFFLTLTLKFEIQDFHIIYSLTQISLIFISILSQNYARKNKKNCEFCQISTNDLYFSLNEDFQMTSRNYSFSRFLKANKISEQAFLLTLLKSRIFVKKEYSEQPEVKELISDSLLDFESSKTKILENYLSNMGKRKEKHFFCLGKIEIFQNNELIYICKRKKRILLKIKREKAFEEAINLQVIAQNYAKTLYYVAHELRNTLNCIVNLELIDSNEKIPFETLSNEFLQPAIISSKLMLNLVNGLLDFAQIEKDTFKLVLSQFDLKELMEDVLKILRLQAKNRGIILELYVDPEIKKLQSDPNRIKQILINLLSNAIKYTKEGRITLKAVRLNYSQIRISVTDTGLGIDENNLKQLFQAFSKIQNKEDFSLNANGVGLGLLISNKLANLLNKKEEGITVSSKLNIGSEFSFKIQHMKNEDELSKDELSIYSSKRVSNLSSSPCKLMRESEDGIAMKEKLNLTYSTFISNKNLESINKDADIYKIDTSSDLCLESKGKLIRRKSSKKQKTQIDNVSLMKKRVEKINNEMMDKRCECPIALIIDDNDFNIMAMKTHLKKLGINCESALSGEIALQKIFKIHENDCCKYFKYIFLDLEMPDKNGLVIYMEITDYYKGLGLVDSTIVLNTGYSKSSEIVKEALRKGVKNILIKPITQMNLVELIDPM